MICQLEQKPGRCRQQHDTDVNCVNMADLHGERVFYGFYCDLEKKQCDTYSTMVMTGLRSGPRPSAVSCAANGIPCEAR